MYANSFSGDLRENLEQIRIMYQSESRRISEFNNLIARSQNEWDEKIDGYEAKVSLRAPREYWECRKNRHSQRADAVRKSWESSVRWVAALLTVLALVLFFGDAEPVRLMYERVFKIQESSRAADVTSQLADVLRRAITFGAIAGMGVWWLRQKLRDLRSHEHLAEDADERVTMIETFAAMRGAGLEGSDFGPIFNALYRNAATGLVTDDGGGPIMPIEIVSKLIDMGKPGKG